MLFHEVVAVAHNVNFGSRKVSTNLPFEQQPAPRAMPGNRHCIALAAWL